MSQWPMLQPYGPPPQPYGPPQLPAMGQQPAPPLPRGHLVLNLRKPAGRLSGIIMAPDVRISGHLVPVQWSRNVFQVAAGQHIVHVQSGALIKYGQATMTVQVVEGQSVEVHYSPPIVKLMPGRMGFEPQPRPGWEVLGIMLAVCLVFPVVLVLAINLAR